MFCIWSFSDYMSRYTQTELDETLHKFSSKSTLFCIKKSVNLYFYLTASQIGPWNRLILVGARWWQKLYFFKLFDHVRILCHLNVVTASYSCFCLFFNLIGCCFDFLRCQIILIDQYLSSTHEEATEALLFGRIILTPHLRS